MNLADTFNRANSATSLGTADSGQVWSALLGTWGISSNRAYCATSDAGNRNVAVLESGNNDGTVSVKIYSAGDGFGLIFRCVDSMNFYLFDWESISSGSFHLYKFVAGTSTSITTSLGSQGSLADGDLMSVDLSGSSIVCKRNGTVVCSATDAALNGTKHGLNTYSSDATLYDDFSFQSSATAYPRALFRARHFAHFDDEELNRFEFWPAGGAVDLVVQDSAHAQTAENLDLTQVHELAVTDAAHSHTGENVALTQVHELAVQDSAHAQTADNIELNVAVTLTVQDASHAQTAANLDLTQVHELAVNAGAHAQAAENIALTQEHALATQDAAHAQAAENIDLIQVHALAVDGTAHAQTSENIALTQEHALALQDAAHAQTAENVALTQIHELAVESTAHAHTAANIDLEVSTVNLSINAGTHAHATEEIVLTQVHELVVADASHAQSAENVALAQVHVLTVSDTAHAQTAEELSLTQVHELAVADSAHAHAAPAIDLTQVHELAVQSAEHAQVAENVVLVIGELSIQDGAHAHSAQNVTLIFTEQEGFRWRNDDGSEASATWAAAQDTNYSAQKQTPVRLRFIINGAGDTDPAQYRIEYRPAGTSDPWSVVS